MKFLEGKFFLRTEGEHFRTGVVVKVAKGTALVQFDNMLGPAASWAMPMELVCVHDEMAHAETEFGKLWSFFETRELLNGYLKRMDTPQQQVVKLVPKKPPR